MTRDANQVAQEHERQQRYVGPSREDATNAGRGKPNRGTLTIWKDGYPKEPSTLNDFTNVTVQLGTPGVIILGSEEGSTYLLYPEPGWYVEFIPNDAGE